MSSNTHNVDGRSEATRWLLALILFGSLAIRLHGIGFGLPALNDPDELMFQLGALKMLGGPTLNPGWFGHPATTTMYLLALVDAGMFAVGWLAGWFPSVNDFAAAIYADPSWVILPGRVAMALFSVWGVYLTYRLGRELLGKRAGLAAAALLTVNPVNIAWSQVIRSDIMATVFLLLTLLAALRIARGGGMRDTVMASLWLALSVATKWPFGLGALAVLAAAALRMHAAPTRRRMELRRVLLFAVMAAGFLFLVSPFLLLEHQTVLRDLQGEVLVHHLGSFPRGPLGRAAWYLGVPILNGIGAAGALLAAAGTALLLRNREARAIIGPVTAAFFLLICAQNLSWERWALPLMPLLSLPAGLAFAALIDFLRARLNPVAAAVVWAAVGAALLLPPGAEAVDNARERIHDTRQIASAWARKNIAAGSSVMVEDFAWDLYAQPWRFLFPVGELGCVDARALLHNKVQYATIDGARGGRTNLDYGTLPAAQRGTCKADYAILTQFDLYRAQRTEFPAEYVAYQDLVSRGRVAARFAPRRGEIGGPIVTIVTFDRPEAPD